MKSQIKRSFAMLLAVGTALLLGLVSARATITVTCVGDSITAGYGLANAGTQSYPAQLQTLLGSGYTVINDGDSARTLQKATGYSYWNSWAYTNSLNSNPNIVVIMLGANDSLSWYWNAANFNTDYRALISQYTNLATHPKVLICYTPPMYPVLVNYGMYFDPVFVENTVEPAIATISTQAGVQLIDNDTPLINRQDLFQDGVHPTQAGAAIVAQQVANAINGLAPTNITTAAITTSGTPSVYGSPVTYTATLTSSSGTVTGAVVFAANNVPFSTNTLSGGTASVTNSLVQIGANVVAAQYVSQGKFLGNTHSLYQNVTATSGLTLTDIGSAPTPGTSDIYQLSTSGNTTWPDGINYFTDNNPPVGQTFATGTNAMKLVSVAIKTAGLNNGGGYGTPASTPTYYLSIYSVSNTTATLLVTVSASNPGFTDGDWLKWSGLNVLLATNKTYAFTFGRQPSSGGYAALAVSTAGYAGGEIVTIPITGGTVVTGGSHSFDAVFDIGLQLAAVTNIPASTPWPNPTYGMNVGNELELNWGPPNIALFYSAVQNGFNAVRIPCAWDMSGATTNISGGVTNYVISPSYMAQVKQTVDAAIAAGMYVMINDHWDDGWLQSNIGTNVDPVINAKVKAYWTQIATTFAGYDNHLLFAVCNEPSVASPAAMSTLMFYYQTFVNAVRAVGGNNTNRWLVLQGGGDTTWLNSLPTDTVSNRLMVEYHNYTPFQFTQLQGDASWGAMQYFWGPAYHYSGDPSHDCGTPEEGAIDSGFQQLVDQYVSKGIPVMIGEFQAAGKQVLSTNATEALWNSLSCYYWNKYLVDSAHAHGMSPFYWSTGNSPFDYGTGAIYDTNAVRVLTGGVAFPPPNGAPYAASGLIATLSNNTNVNLSWTAGSGATSYNLYRAAESGGEPTNPVVTGITGTTYTDTNLNSGTTYYYQVVAVNGSGMAGYSPEAHATTTGVNPDPAQFNFETDPQGWAGGGGIISGVATSTAQHYAGKQSLAVNINSTNANSSAVNIGNVSVLPGQTITFHVWIPSGSKITSLQPYIQDNNWTWTWGDYNGSLTGNAWNTVTVTVPANAVSPFHYLNLQFNASAAWTGTCYVDSVSWNAPAPDFSVAANPASLTVQGGSSGTSTTTLTALNGLNGCYTLSASNLPSGVTATFAANPITGGANTLTFTASNTVTSGTSNVTITATCGSLSHTTTIALTLNPFTSPAATNFTWSVPTPITTADATLSPPSGSVLVGAAAFGGTAYTVTLTNGTQINFTANGSVATATGSGTATGSFSGNTSNANFNVVLNEFNYDGGPKTITLTNLTAGSRYIVMFFGLDDRSPENLRQAYLQDPNLSGDVSQTWQMGSNVCVMGAFTATSSIKTLFEQLPGNSSGGDVLMGNANALVLWMVASSNTPPTLAAITNRTVNVGQTVTFTASATDTDSPPQTLTFALLAGATNATLNTNSGAFLFRPLVTQANSTNNFTLQVSDNGTPSLSATQSFAVVVNPLTAPGISTVSVAGGQFSFNVSGQAGPDYAVETSTNLMDWSTIFVTNSPALPFVWTDTNSAAPQRFYRVKLGPPLP